MDQTRREAVRRVLRAAGPEHSDPTGLDRALWSQICTLGWPGQSPPGSGVSASCAFAEELGAALRPEPFIPAVMAARLLPADRLCQVMKGERIVLPAWQEQPNSLATAGMTTLHGGRLSGRKIHIPLALAADAFVVTLPDGVALVERDAGGINLETAGSDDGQHVGSLVLNGVPTDHLSGDVDAALDEAILASAAYLLGLADRVAADTRKVVTSRRHLTRQPRAIEAQREQRIDEIAMQLALMRTAMGSASATLGGAVRSAVRASLVSKAWLRAVDATSIITRTCVQLVALQALPGIAELQRFQRRASAMSKLYGSPMAHRARVPVAPELSDEGAA